MPFLNSAGARHTHGPYAHELTDKTFIHVKLDKHTNKNACPSHCQHAAQDSYEWGSTQKLLRFLLALMTI